MISAIRIQVLRLRQICRTFYWRLLFRRLGKGTLIFGRITARAPERISIGEGCTLNEGVIFNVKSEVRIGDHVRISSGVIINSTGLDYRTSDRPHIEEPVFIGDHVWVGAGAIINPGVHIGSHSVIGAGAVVTGDIPDHVVAIGVPARVVKEITV